MLTFQCKKRSVYEIRLSPALAAAVYETINLKYKMNMNGHIKEYCSHPTLTPDSQTVRGHLACPHPTSPSATKALPSHPIPSLQSIDTREDDLRLLFCPWLVMFLDEVILKVLIVKVTTGDAMDRTSFGLTRNHLLLFFLFLFFVSGGY